jgi:uncharacterized repeat protein (TIGR02543 family)
VVPANATNKAISWKIAEASGSIANTRLTATAPGKVTLTGTVANGAGAGVDYTENFELTVVEPPPDTFTVTFYASGGTFADDEITHIEYVNNDGYTSVTQPSPDPARDYYTFKGWYTSASGGSQWNFADPITGNTDIYAQWEAIVYTITYTTGGGYAIIPNPTSYTYESPDLTIYDLTRIGYTTGGWFDNEEYTGSRVTKIPAGSSGDKHFYAKWNLTTYNINYVLYGGTNHPGNPATYNIETPTIILQTPTRDGYSFEAWYYDSAFTGNAATEIPTGSSYGKTFYAKWTVAGSAPSTGEQKIDTVAGIQIAFRYVPPTAGIGTGGFKYYFQKYAVITYGYWMAETEVTQELFEQVMGINPSKFKPPTYLPAGTEVQTRRPAESMNLYQAIAFCNKLSILAGRQPVYTVSGVSDWAALPYSSIPTTNNANWNQAALPSGFSPASPSANGYRLPGELEWLWAAMGATEGSRPSYPVAEHGYNKRYAGSTEAPGKADNAINYVWYWKNANETHEVAKKLPNELGIRDMTGNVDEYVWSSINVEPSQATETDFLPDCISGASSHSTYIMGYAYGDTITYDLSTTLSSMDQHRGSGDLGLRILRPLD